MKNKFIILFTLLTILLFSSCKSAEERLEEKYPDDAVKGMVRDAFSNYIDLDIKKISVTRLCTEEGIDQITAEGNAISKKYDGKTFGFYVILNKGSFQRDLEHPDISIGIISYQGMGQIVDIYNDIVDEEEYIDCKEFRERSIKLDSINRLINEESRNAVNLAYANKTKVHFGMTKKEFKECDVGFYRNFIDGLIGEGATQLTKPTFAKDKFVGFEVVGTTHNNIRSYANVLKMAKLVDSRYLNGSIRFDSYESYYLCDLYNLKLFEQTDGSSGESHQTITVWWNKYLKLYN